MDVQQKANKWFPGIGGGKEMRNGCLMGTGFPLRVMKMFLELDRSCNDTHSECIKYHRIVHFKVANFMLH